MKTGILKVGAMTVAVSGIVLIAATGYATHPCATARCGSPERCVLQQFKMEMLALHQVMQQVSKTGFAGTSQQLEAEAQKALDHVDPGVCKVPPTLGDGAAVGGDTGVAFGVCTSSITVEGHGAMPASKNDAPNPNLYNFQTCTEIMDAVYLHEHKHFDRCQQARQKTPPEKYPPADVKAFAADDAAAYLAEVRQIDGKLKESGRTTTCSGDTRMKNRTRDSVAAALKAFGPSGGK